MDVEEFNGVILESIRLLTSGVTDFVLLPNLVRSIVDCIEESDPDSTPGIPLNFYGKKKSMWNEDQKQMVLLVLDRLRKMLWYNGKHVTGIDLVDALVCDPIYTFIKDEPHKREKLDTNRLRIISGVSLVDNLIERLLFSTLNKLEIEINEYIPYKPGMGLHDEGQEQLFSWFKRLQAEYRICSSDVSGWDWSVTAYLLDADLRYRCGFANGCGAWIQLALIRFECLKYKVFQLPSGEMYTQDKPGIQCSGSYLTSSSNSHMRQILSLIAQLELGCDKESFAEGGQMGDDALERYLDGLLDEYQRLGFTVKGVEVMPDGDFSFCSTHWKGKPHGEPESWTKTLFRFLHKKPTDPNYVELERQFRRDLRHLPQVNEIVDRVNKFRELYT